MLGLKTAFVIPTKRSNFTWLLSITAVGLLMGTPTLSNAPLTHRELMRSGDMPTGLPAGMKIGTFLSTNASSLTVEAVVNSSGAVAFIVPLVPTNGSSAEEIDALFLDKDDGAGPELIGMTGGQISGITNRIFRQLQNLNIGDDGSLLVDDHDPNASPPQTAILHRTTNDVWQILAEDGQPIAGQPTDPFYGDPYFGNIGTINEGVLMQTGGGGLQTLFGSAYDFFGFTFAYWGWDKNVNQVFRFATSGEQAPGMATNELLNGFINGGIAPGTPGLAVLQGQYSVQNSPDGGYAVWLGPLTNLTVIARTGNAVPTRESYSFVSFGTLGINSSGQACFYGQWKTNEIPLRINRGVFRHVEGTNWWIVGDGDPSPGQGGAAGVIESLVSAVMNSQGQVFFQAAVRRTNNSLVPRELIRWDPNLGLNRLGFPADPDTNLLSELTVERFSANGTGGVAARVDGPGGPGIWATAGGDEPQLIAYSDWDLTPVPDGAINVAYCEIPRSLYTAPTASGGQDGRARFYSDNNKLVFAARLAEAGDPSALILTSVNPEDQAWFTFPGVQFPISFPVGGPQADFSGTTLDIRKAIFETPAPTTSAPTNFDGGSLLAEVVTNAMADDRIRLVISNAVVPVGSVFIDGTSVGTLSYPSNSLQIDFNSNATPERVAELMSGLTFGTGFMERFGADPEHQEPFRVARLSLSDGTTNSLTVHRTIDFPWITGVKTDEVEDSQDFLNLTMALQAVLLLSNGAEYVPSADIAFGESIEWHLTHLNGYNQAADMRPPNYWLFPEDPSAAKTNVFGTTALAQVVFGEDYDFVRANADIEISISNLFSNRGRLTGTRQRTFSGWIAGHYDDANDNGCMLLRISDDWHPGYFRDQGYTYFLGFTPEPTASVASLSVAEAASEPFSLSMLPMLRALNVWMNGSEEGRRLAGLYYQFSGELIMLSTNDPPLIEEALNIVAAFAPGVTAMISGNGETFLITQEMIDQLNAWVDQILTVASPELANAINTEWARFNDLQDFVGQDMAQWGQMLEIAAPTEPFIAVTSAGTIANGFRLEANLIPGLTQTLLSTLNPASGWQPVTNLFTETDAYSIIFYDTNAPNDRSFYRIEATP